MRLVGFAEGVGQALSVEQEPRDFSSVPLVHARVSVNSKVFRLDETRSFRALLRALDAGDRRRRSLLNAAAREAAAREHGRMLAELRVPASLRHAHEALRGARERLARATPGTDSYAFETRNVEIALRAVRSHGVHEDE